MPHTQSVSPLLAVSPAQPASADSRFESLVDSIDGVFFEFDAETNCFTYVSRRAQALLGFPLKDWLKPPFWVERLHPDDAPRTITTCKTLTDAAVDHVLNHGLVAADGRAVWVHEVVGVQPRPGRPPLLSGVMLDVKREREQERLIELLSQSALQRTGDDFFLALTRQLSELLGAEFVLLGELINKGAQIRTLAAHRAGAHLPPLVYEMDGSACAEATEKGWLVADGDLQARFGRTPVVAQLALDSLVCTAVCSPRGERTGVLTVGFPGRVSNPERFLRPLQIFAARAGAQLERVRAEREARAIEQRVRELIDALPDEAFLFDREARAT